MATPRKAPSSEPVPIPLTPTVEAWSAMSPAAKLDFQLRVIDALNAAADVMGEGRPHKKAKTRTLDALGLHFKATGRSVYLAEEMVVLYPDAAPFTPDILAVVDVAEPEEAVSEAVRERILGEEDTKRLDRWLEKAIVVTSADEVLHADDERAV